MRDHSLHTSPDDNQDMTTMPGRWVLLVCSDMLGSGDPQLGRILMRNYLYTLTQAAHMPRSVIFLNGGVRLATAGSEVLDDLAVLAEEGVQILSCGTCLDYFGLKDRLEVGAVTNMYAISEELLEAERVISL